MSLVPHRYVPMYVFPYSHFSVCLLPKSFLSHFSFFLLFPCAHVEDNTRARVPHFL